MHEFTCGRCQDAHDEQAKEIVELKKSQSRLEQNWWDSATDAKTMTKELIKANMTVESLKAKLQEIRECVGLGLHGSTDPNATDAEVLCRIYTILENGT